MIFFFASEMLSSHSCLPWFLFLDFQEPSTFFQHLLLIIAADSAADSAVVADLVAAADLAVVGLVAVADLAAVVLVAAVADLVAVGLVVAADLAVAVAVAVAGSFSNEHIPDYIWHLRHQD